MTTRTWTATNGNFKWETASNWSGGMTPQAGDDVVLPSQSGGPYTVDLSSATPKLNSLAIGNDASLNNNTNAVTLVLDAGASLTTTGAISIALYGTIEGQGSINAGGGFNIVNAGAGTPHILAGTAHAGGALDLTGAIAYGIALGFANTSKATTLKLESANSFSSIAITAKNQTLELGASANVTFNSLESIAGGSIVLDGSTLTAANGVALSSSAALTGTGIVQGNITGQGAITASGGTLTLTQAVGNDASGQTSLVIGSGSTLLLTSAYGIGASGSVEPTLTFQGTGDIFQASNIYIGNIYIGTITGFAAGDYIKLGSFGSGDKLVYSASAPNQIKITDAGGYNSQTFTFASSTVASQVQLSQQTVNGQTIDLLTICFMSGTMIRTAAGEVPVESLERGDLVLTAEGEARPVVWIGRQTIASRFANPLRNWPIRVAAGAIADNVPCRDLLVSPEHALLVGDILVHAGALVNGTTIRRESHVPETFVYYHVELDDHSLILAENVPAETFVDNVDRRHFDNWAEHQEMFPDGRAIEELPFPRAKARRQVPMAMRRALEARAAALFHGVAAAKAR